MRSAKAVVSENLARYNMSHGMNMQRPPPHTITSLKRWSVLNKDLPAVSQIRAIHVYDFDNTLFLSPLPNPQLWHTSTIGLLQGSDTFANGGWWHDPNILSATGKGMDKEEPRGWEGWWNDNILRLVKLSMEQKDALTVLLTGRSEAGFVEIIKRMVDSQKLDFDLAGLKPEVGPNNQYFANTMKFKQIFLEDLVLTYDQAEEIRVYEDRVKHVKGFRDFFEDLNRTYQSGQANTPRKPINAEVIQVYEGCTYLDPVTETAEVQRMINSHNLAKRNPSLGKSKPWQPALRIKRNLIYTGYLISQKDTERLIHDVLNPMLPNGLAESHDLKCMANSILITPRPAPRHVLDKVGGLGKKISWQITGIATFENRVWAARVAPVPSTEQYSTDTPVPLIVLAVRRNSRPIDANKIMNWQPAPANKALTVETVVGEKVILRIEEDSSSEGDGENLSRTKKRRYQQERDEDILYPQTSQNNGYEAPSQGHVYHPYQRHQGDNRHYFDDGPRRGSNRGRGRGNGRGRGYSTRGGRGRGRGHNAASNPYYKSLDDYAGGYEASHGDRSGHGGGGYSMDY
ncbi:uncharacterized protein N7459_000406 [Penicillium hispanicum]|uniref:uncharacterized protein n=1 Tax=Penicillium hispanicum TaxID=1080232 RepID=UPI0025414D9D|nr:uncharacterized protein N7459_000406 [Penicillium hispanicum]KAJ5594198.1 hypothetical protein N7459_000406 [Penicillium hispanicum]